MYISLNFRIELCKVMIFANYWCAKRFISCIVYCKSYFNVMLNVESPLVQEGFCIYMEASLIDFITLELKIKVVFILPTSIADFLITRSNLFLWMIEVYWFHLTPCVSWYLYCSFVVIHFVWQYTEWPSWIIDDMNI